MDLYLLVILVSSTRILTVSSQVLSYNCPANWVPFEQSCLRFVEDSPKIVDEAAADCWVNGSSLVSVKTFAKNRFIADWLLRNALYSPRNWTTGGYSSNNLLIWNDDDELFTGPKYWITAPLHTRIGYVKYTFDYATGNFGWTLGSPSLVDNYICEIPVQRVPELKIIERGIDYGLGIVDKSHIERGPKIIQEPMSVVIFGPSSSIYLECTVEGYPLPRITWTAGTLGNETEITSATDNRFTLTGGRLSLESPTAGDVDSYRCYAENKIGRVVGQVALITYGYLEAFSPLRPANVIAEEFKGVKIDCLAPAYKPLAKFQWFKNDASNYIFPNHLTHFISNAGFLYMSDVQPTDEVREYFCVVTLAAPAGVQLANSQPPSRTSLGTWLILRSGNAEPYGPIIHTHTFPSPVVRGRTLRLECIAYGTTPLMYSWSREGDLPFSPNMELSDRDRVLTIPNVQIHDEGNYICHVSRPGNAGSKVISVIVEAIPYFPVPINNMFVDPGQSVRWRCMAVARPKATYVWYKNGVPIKIIPGEVEVQKSTLYIRQIDAARDEGMYQCAATNWHGTAFSTGQLKVLTLKPNFDRYPLPPLTLVALGGNTSIPCSVEAAPPPTVQWLKNGGNMNLFPGVTDGRVFMTLSNDLVITDATPSDAGQYTCQASNTLGDAVNTTVIQVVAGISIVNPPVPTTVLVNTTAFLSCQATYNDRQYDLIYIWRFNWKLIDFGLSDHHVVGERYGQSGLYIREAQYTNMGLYECEARTILHSARRAAFVTVQGPPGPPAGVYVDDQSVTSTSVRLIWTDGVEIAHGSPLISYDVEAESHYHPNVWEIVASNIPYPMAVADAVSHGLKPDQRTTVLTSLIPNTGYRFRVRAINSLGKGKDPSNPSSSTQLPQTRPVLWPSNIRGGMGKVGTLAIVWTPLDKSEHCGPGIGYTIFWRKQGTTNWNQKSVTGNVGTVSATVGLENYYTLYDVKVAAFNDLGDGPESNIVSIYSAEGMPVATPKMQDVDGLNGTAVILNWTPVPDNRDNMKGRVQGYILNYFLNDQGFSTNANWEPENVMQKRVYGQQSSAMIIGLESNSEYYVRVMVFNTAGEGPKGEWRRAETNNFPPRKFPVFVEVMPESEHSVRVFWRGVSTAPDEESLQGYIIRVWKIQEDIRTAEDTVVGKVDEAVVDGLQSRTVYVVRVIAYSNGGEGAYSPAVYFTVLGGNIPFDPTTSEICYSGHTCSSALRTAHASYLLLLLSYLLATILLKH